MVYDLSSPCGKLIFMTTDGVQTMIRWHATLALLLVLKSVFRNVHGAGTGGLTRQLPANGGPGYRQYVATN
jgi:hypothetical protein